MQADAVYRDGARPRSRAGGAGGSRKRRPVQNLSPFRCLARTHAFAAMGDAAMYGALAGSVLGLDTSGQRSAVLRYLIVSFAPFVVVAPLIGPTIDRIPGGRRAVVQITAVVRAVLYVIMAFHTNDLALYPLMFVALVMQKTYAVSKSALVPMVVRDADELVEANSKLGLISGVVGALAIGPLAGIGHISPSAALIIGTGLFAMAALNARRLPRDAVAAAPAEREEKVELRSSGVILASGAMALIRVTIGFLTFHLMFWLKQEYGLAQFGLAAAASTVGSMLGNIAAPTLRRSLREETMLTIALAVICGAGVGAALTGGLGTAIVLALVINFSSSIGRLAFDSIVQRDAPDANQGRAFAQFETRFQLAWVLGCLPPVFFTLPGQVGFVVVAAIGGFAAASYLIGSRAVRAGKPLPMSLGQRAKLGLAAKVAERRGNTPPKGSARPAPKPVPKRNVEPAAGATSVVEKTLQERRRRGGTLPPPQGERRPRP